MGQTAKWTVEAKAPHLAWFKASLTSVASSALRGLTPKWTRVLAFTSLPQCIISLIRLPYHQYLVFTDSRSIRPKARSDLFYI
jgi:hypothetical protein